MKNFKFLIVVCSMMFVRGIIYSQGLNNDRNQILAFEQKRAESIISNDSMIISKIKISKGFNYPIETNTYKFDQLYNGGEYYETPSEITYIFSNIKNETAKSKFDADVKLLKKLKIPYTLKDNTLQYVSKKGSTVVTLSFNKSKRTGKSEVFEEVYTRVRSIGKVELGATKYEVAYTVYRDELYNEENYGPDGDEFVVDLTPRYLKDEDQIENFGEHGGYIVYIKNGVAIAAVSEYKDGPEILFYDKSHHDYLKDIEYNLFSGSNITLGSILK